MKIQKFVAIVALLFATLSAQDNMKDTQDKDNKKSWEYSEELKNSEKNLDDRISILLKQFKEYASMKGKKIKYSPFQTKVRTTDESVELELYSFIRKAFHDSQTVGYRVKTVSLFFSGDSLNKVISKIYQENFLTKAKTSITVLDPSPLDNNTSDISITSSINDTKPAEVITLGKMKNTLLTPNRISFKRDFYLPHMDQFERLYHYTQRFEEQYALNNEVQTIEFLKESLIY